MKEAKKEGIKKEEREGGKKKGGEEGEGRLINSYIFKFKFTLR